MKANSEEEHRLLSEGLRAVRQRDAFKRQLAAELSQDSARRLKVSSRFRHKLFSDALRAAISDLVHAVNLLG